MVEDPLSRRPWYRRRAIRQSRDAPRGGGGGRGGRPRPWVAPRHWTRVAANASVGFSMDQVPPDLRVPPINVLRASLHPQGMASRIVNLAEWRAHILHRLRRQV